MNNNKSMWTLVVAVNNDAVLENTLLQSPDIDSNCQVLLKRGFPSAGAAYNSGLAEGTSEIVVFAHQDVYFPKGWKEDLDRSIRALEKKHSEWGVLGVFGISAGIDGKPTGHCYSTGLRRVVGEPFSKPVRARSLDELVLIVRRNSGLSFDDKLSGFHLYGTDICLSAHFAGLDCHIVPAFCIHNSNGVKYLPPAYWRCYFYMRHKWRNVLPVTTCCSLISRSLKPFAAQVISDIRLWLRGGRDVGTRSDDVVSLWNSLALTADAGKTEPSSMERYV